MRLNLIPIVLLCFLALMSVPLKAHQSSDIDAYRFGVFPYLSTMRLEAAYAPIAAELGKAIGHEVTFKTSSEFQIFKSQLEAGNYDIAIIPPFLYPLTVDRNQYLPLLKVEEPLYSLVLVTEDSPIDNIQALRGKLLALPPVNGPVVAIAKRELAAQGINPETDLKMKSTKSVSSCLQQIVLKTADACIAPSFAQTTFEMSMKVKLRPLLRSQASPNRTLVVHPRVTQQKRDRIKQAFLSWRSSETGKALLQAINTKGFVEVNDGEFDLIRDLVRETGNP